MFPAALCFAPDANELCTSSSLENSSVFQSFDGYHTQSSEDGGNDGKVCTTKFLHWSKYLLFRMVRGNFPFSPSYPSRRPPPYYYQSPPPYPHAQTQYLGHSNEIYYTNHIEDQYEQNDPFVSTNNIVSQGQEPYYEEASCKCDLRGQLIF